MKSSYRHNKLRFSALIATSALLLASCGGAAGGDSEGADRGASVEPGATKEEYAEALADMEPVELTFQAASSATGGNADRDRAFAEAIEEWSDGKISVEVLFGYPIASASEVAPALQDGRLDLAYEIPQYAPAEYPGISELVNLQSSGGSGTAFSDFVNVAATAEVAWNTPEILSDYETMGVTPLVPVEAEFSHVAMCTTQADTASGLNGSVISAGSPDLLQMIDSIGASGTSLPYTELYEGLQRGVIDCAVNGLKVGMATGVSEVAPHIVAPQDGSLGRSTAALLAGGQWDDLPLAAQQLIFDKLVVYINGHFDVSTRDYTQAMEDFTGGFHEVDDETEASISATVDALRSEVESTDVLDGSQLVTNYDAAQEKWVGIAEELGYEENGNWSEYTAELGAEAPDFMPLAERMMDEIYLEHRPAE